MSSRALRLYHRLPPPLRDGVATARGLYLHRWRYGRDAEERVQAALERESWSPARWRAWQAERLARILHRAATRVPFYREQWATRRRRGERAPVDELASWPLLDKEALRARPRAFLADDRDPRRMFPEHTSGTSGTPLQLWWSRELSQAWFALFEARARRWHGVRRHDPWASLGGQLVVPAGQRRPPYWVRNLAARQLYLSIFHLAPATVAAYLGALRAHGTVSLLGYPSALHALAGLAREAGLAAPQLRVVLSNAETLFPQQRAATEALFRCPLRDTYGQAELVCAASECPAGALHLWPEVGRLELLAPDGAPAPDGALGRIVATSLLQADMPLIRYDTGDLAARPATQEPCPCGRTLPTLARVAGRADDLLLTRDGRRVGRMDGMFKASLPIREALIVQESPERVRLHLVPAPGFAAAHADDLRARVRARLGEVDVALHLDERLPRGAGGKLRAVRREFPLPEPGRLKP